MLTVALLVTAAAKTSLQNAIADATPLDTVNFTRRVCALSESATWESPVTHYYASAESVTQELHDAWTALVPTIPGAQVFVGVDLTDSLSWGIANMAAAGVMFLPDEPA